MAVMFTKAMRKLLKFTRYGMGHCDGSSGGGNGHCY